MLIAATGDYTLTSMWRVISMPAPPCDIGLYARPEAPVVSYSRHGIFLTIVLKCHETATKLLRYSAPRIIAMDKVGGDLI